MKFREIHDDRELYQAVIDYTTRVWDWKAHIDEDCEIPPTPEELIDLLRERIEWVQEHRRIVDRYLRRRTGPTWVRVIEGSGANSTR